MPSDPPTRNTARTGRNRLLGGCDPMHMEHSAQSAHPFPRCLRVCRFVGGLPRPVLPPSAAVLRDVPCAAFPAQGCCRPPNNGQRMEVRMHHHGWAWFSVPCAALLAQGLPAHPTCPAWTWFCLPGAALPALCSNGKSACAAGNQATAQCSLPSGAGRPLPH